MFWVLKRIVSSRRFFRVPTSHVLVKKYLSPRFFKKAKGILLSPLSVRPSVMLSPPKPLDEIQPNLVCELLT